MYVKDVIDKLKLLNIIIKTIYNSNSFYFYKWFLGRFYKKINDNKPFSNIKNQSNQRN